MTRLIYYVLGLLSGMAITGLGLAIYQHRSQLIIFMVFLTIVTVGGSFSLALCEEVEEEDDEEISK